MTHKYSRRSTSATPTTKKYNLSGYAACLISFLKDGHYGALLDDLTELFRSQPSRVQRKMAQALFLAICYGSVEDYKFSDTGDDRLDDVLDALLGELMFRMRGMDYLMSKCGLSWEKAFKTYTTIIENYPYKSIYEH